MSSAPAWVSYAALALSAGSVAVSALAYKAGGPRLLLRAESYRGGFEDDPFLSGATHALTVVNAGRGAVTVEGFSVTPYGERKPAAGVGEVDGPDLPYRLEAHASETWLVDALVAARNYDARIRDGLDPQSSWPSRFRFSVVAGDGKRASSGETFDSLRIIADASPGG